VLTNTIDSLAMQCNDSEPSYHQGPYGHATLALDKMTQHDSLVFTRRRTQDAVTESLWGVDERCTKDLSEWLSWKGGEGNELTARKLHQEWKVRPACRDCDKALAEWPEDKWNERDIENMVCVACQAGECCNWPEYRAGVCQTCGTKEGDELATSTHTPLHCLQCGQEGAMVGYRNDGGSEVQRSLITSLVALPRQELFGS